MICKMFIENVVYPELASTEESYQVSRLQIVCQEISDKQLLVEPGQNQRRNLAKGPTLFLGSPQMQSSQSTTTRPMALY